MVLLTAFKLNQAKSYTVFWGFSTATYKSVTTRFCVLLSCSPWYQQPEGDTTLAATEFVRLLEVSGSITAKQSNGTTENTQLLGSTAEFNPMTRTERKAYPKNNLQGRAI